ncbi:DNA-deoxyinosine glycosylase [Undibacterium oligocarboniphilum]|uniref:DNA-deoxyinosine glycosylase n=1 Tax=Undibacterium oligocarboniphilum TaxID=666702 RepID=A0A850QF32_9BURK|nr:DNA-deoxyinosine glycosylase [Undibacterium oligocarboniphilum]MBC3871559.1 DNA-deoxyinosine glycosylase [Undibacterium oligocarboniphilum]NVO79082.1 DNA-deoxyinosine glycosylase [Undibacterium oligocarboniphilum]
MTYATAQAPSAARNNTIERLSGFPPVINADTHTLILGSFPGNASLLAGQYYAFRHNQFWRLLSEVVERDLTALDYPDKLAALLQQGIGLWDIFRHCQRQGSLDTAIRNGELNDFSALHQRYPRLQRVCFNGQTAARLQRWFREQGFQTLVLPSSSPAHASKSFRQKCLEWQRLRHVADDSAPPPLQAAPDSGQH